MLFLVVFLNISFNLKYILFDDIRACWYEGDIMRFQVREAQFIECCCQHIMIGWMDIEVKEGQR